MRLVVKLGGEVVARASEAAAIAGDVAALVRAGRQVVVVHGGGPQVSDLSRRLGLAPRVVGGRRITDEATLDVVKMVVAGKLNVDLCAHLVAAGARPVGLHGGGGPVVLARRRPPRVYAGAGPEPVDLGLVGDVVGFDLTLLDELAAAGRVAVLACLGGDAGGAVYNINADVVAAELAVALRADKLLLVSGVPGVLRDAADPTTRIPRLTLAEARRAIADGTVRGGMIPKLEEASAALEAGVAEVQVLGALGPGDLRRAVDAPGEVGTALVRA